MSLRDELQSFFKGDLDDSPKTLEMYSHDASIFSVRPALVVYPKGVDDIKKLALFVNEAKQKGRNISLTARSGGTDMTGGPLSESIIIDMTRSFNQIKEVGADFAVVQPGVYYRDFEKETLKHNLILPSYPASREICTVGGMVANNSGGEKTLQYGKTERYVRELKMILRDGNEYTFKKITKEELESKINAGGVEGEIYKNLSALIKQNQDILTKAKPDVTKNSSGYFLWNVYDPADGTFDITKVITGSQGTFGIITEITFALVKPKPFSRMLVIFLKDIKRLSELTEAILVHKPESFESYDDNTFRLAIKFFPEMIHRIKGGMLRIMLSFIPELWMIMTSGIPKLVLLIEFTSDTVEEATRKAEAAHKALHTKFTYKMHVTKSDTETQEFWVVRRESFNLLRKHVKGLRTAPFIDDFAVNHKYLPEFLPKLYTILARYSLIYTVAGHVGDGNFHIIPLMKLADPKSKDIIIKLSREVYDLVLSYKGAITAEHNDGLIRTPFLKQAYGEEVYTLFEKTKEIFDPNTIFNPGKKVGADTRYVLAHLDTRV